MWQSSWDLGANWVKYYIGKELNTKRKIFSHLYFSIEHTYLTYHTWQDQNNIFLTLPGLCWANNKFLQHHTFDWVGLGCFSLYIAKITKVVNHNYVWIIKSYFCTMYAHLSCTNTTALCNSLSYIIKFSLSVCLCVSMWVCWSGIGSKTMRTTVMKLLQVTQWV